MKFMKTFAIFLFAQAALFFNACNTGLGDAVDLKGPTVTIISPEARENVGERFEIHGTVTDDFAVGIVTVELDGSTWQHKGSGWQYKAKGENNFVPDTESEWISENKKSVEWTIKGATISGAGTFTIEVKALDESGNSSEESSKSRDVIIDKDAPKITISTPPMAQDLKTFTSITDYKDITKVTQFLTGDFSVSGKTSEENAIQYIEVLIKEYGAEDELFRKRIVQNESNKTSESDIVVDALRSWEIPVKLNECALGNLNEKQHILNIYTSTCDTAGNDSGLQFQGHACMWKEADKPWIDIILGDETTPKNVYSGSSVLGNAYDDTAIKSVNVTIKKKDGSILSQNQIYSADDSTEDENNVYFELPLPTDSDVYSLEISATDKNGKASDTKTGWIKVVDKMFPSIEISQEISNNTESGKLFCDEDGNFTLKIISKDESKVASLKMAYITNPTDTVLYSDSISTKWYNNSTSLNDLAAGKVYEITPKDTGEIVIENNLKRKIYENEVKINIFNHLGIDGSTRKLTNQTFAFRVEDADKNALTSTYAIQGDIDSPEIQFTKLEYYSYKGSEAITRMQEGGNALPAFGENTFVKVYGKIGDNSTDILGKYAKHLKLDLTVNGNSITPSVTNNDGNFVAEAGNLTGASLVFEGNVIDWGGNSKKQKYSFLVDSQTPRVEYISALNQDGSYGVGKTIKIFIRFNKKLDFQGTPKITLNNGAEVVKSDTADKNIGENDILFEYTIEKGQDVDLLKVTKADLGTVTYGEAPVTLQIRESIDEITGNDGFGKNLHQMKNIGIITSNPKVETISFIDEKTLEIKYNKAVAKGSGVVTITQLNSEGKPGVDKVPAVLTESEGRTLFANNSKLKNCYELTTNGADKNFKADLTSKYVLKYEYNSDGSKEPSNSDINVINEYIATDAHILSQDVRAQGVKVEGKTVTITFNSSLPCKGAKYKIKVPEGFMQDKNGGSSFPADEYSNNITADGVETPVIRIKKGTTTVYNENNVYKAKQPLEAEFKVDCETPNVSLQYKFVEYTRNRFTVVGNGTNVGPDINPPDRNKDTKTPNYTNNTFKDYNSNELPTLGKNSNYDIGLEYHITAKAGTSEEAHAVAYRTTIEILNVTMPDKNTEKDKDKPNWNTPNADNLNKSQGCGLFIRGGDVASGSNITQGLPTDWDITHNEKTCLLTESGNNYHFTTWAITKDYYFMFLAGLMDKSTLSDNEGISQGPYCGIFAQNSWVSFYKNYPVPPGGYVQIQNGTNPFDFDLATTGKVLQYRNPSN